MKGIGFKIIIVSAVFCAVFTACNFNINGGKELAEVRVGSAGSQRAADPLTGLPVFDGSNTTITISDASGRLIAEGPLPLSAEVVVGIEIVVKATVRTASGTWSRTKTHTVKAGINDIDLELSKTPKVVGNFFFDVVETVPLSGVKLRLKFRNGKNFPDTIRMGGNYHKPVTARDSIGRLYLLYHDGSAKKFTRFDVDGNEDMGFQTAVALQLPLPNGISDIDNIAVDAENNYIFLFNDKIVYCLKETAHNHFTCSAGFNMGTLSGMGPSNTITAVTAYDDVLFLTVKDGNTERLIACSIGFSGSTLMLSHKARAVLSKLRTHTDFTANATNCTDLFADEDGVYCLLNEQKLDSGMLYALGQLVRYTYTGSSFADETKVGLSSDNVSNNNPVVAFDAQYFSNPIGFIGYDEENIYIADDGIDIQYVNENWRIIGNQNRIAAFNRKTNGMSFDDAGNATWFAEHSVYKKPNTKMLLWEEGHFGKRYWTSTDGAEAFSEANKLFADTSSERPTDVFCYDQDGNLYILWKDNSNYNVRRFALKEDGSYEKPGVDSVLTSSTVSAIAVDISNGQNILYFAYAVGSSGHIQKKSWSLGAPFSSATSITGYDLTFTASDTSVTALAANKDGVFVVEKKQHLPTDPYTLTIKKYKKAGSPDGEIVIVEEGEAQSAHEVHAPYDFYRETVTALQVIDGVLYGISSKTTESRKYISNHYENDVFKHDSVLYKIGSTKGSLSGNAVVLAKKDGDEASKIGYGFYRFIAVKNDEAERIRLIIASDGAWGTNGSGNPPGDPKNTDKVLEYDLAGNLLVERNSGGSFSQKLTHIVGTGFSWY